MPAASLEKNPPQNVLQGDPDAVGTLLQGGTDYLNNLWPMSKEGSLICWTETFLVFKDGPGNPLGCLPNIKISEPLYIPHFVA